MGWGKFIGTAGLFGAYALSRRFHLLRNCKKLLIAKVDATVDLAELDRRSAKLHNVFQCFPDLKVAYSQLQTFHSLRRRCENYTAIYSTKDSDRQKSFFFSNIEIAIRDWANACIDSDIDELAEAGTTLHKWSAFIANAWRFPQYNNGIVEGKNT